MAASEAHVDEVFRLLNDGKRDAARAALVDRLFREHNQSLLRFLTAKLGSAHEAKDIAQEAYVRMLQLDSPEAVGYLRAFLFKTAANLAIDRLRARQTENRSLELAFFDHAATAAANHGTADATDADLIEAEQLDLITRYVAELPAKIRYAFLLRRLEDLTCEEIAARMQISPRTVRHYLVEAIIYCRSRLTSGRASPARAQR